MHRHTSWKGSMRMTIGRTLLRSRVLPLVLLVFTSLLLVVCDQAGSDDPLSPESEAPQIVQAGSGGDDAFVFLEPLVKGSTIPDAFNPNLDLWIDICPVDPQADLSTTGNSVCVMEGSEPKYLRRFGPPDITVEPDRYKREWKLDAAEGAVTVGETYRVLVRAGPYVLGSADIAVLANMGARNTLTGDEIAVNENRTVVIAFHAGAIGECEEGLDCGIDVVARSTGAQVTSEDGRATAIFEPDWYDPIYGDEVTVIISEKPYSPESPCLPPDRGEGKFDQFGSCYTYTTVPDVGPFLKDAIVGQCMDATAQAAVDRYGEVLQLAMWDHDYTEIHRLPNAAVAGLNCEGYVYENAGWGTRLAHAMFSWLVPPLHASHRGLGGLTGTFSDAAWTLWFDLGKVSGDQQTGGVNTTLTKPIVVRYETKHTEAFEIGVAEDHGPLANEPLTFDAYATEAWKDATPYSSETVHTDANGEVAYAWTLGGSAGTHTLVVRHTSDHHVEFTATAEPVIIATSGTVSGIVLDAASLEPVPGLTVRIQENSDETLTDAAGQYLFKNVPTGIKTISLTGIPGQQRVVGVPANVTTTVDFLMGAAITSFTLSMTTLMLEVIGPEHTTTITNTTGSTLTGVSVQGQIEQAGVREAAGERLVDCGGAALGDLPPGDCTVTYPFTASNYGGTADLTPGLATAIMQLRIDSDILDERLQPVTLEAAPTNIFGAGLSGAPFPDPVLEFDRIESYTVDGVENWRWRFRVANWDDYDDALFADATTCGINTSAARTWVDLEDGSGSYVYGFCDLGAATNLQDIWFGRRKGAPYPASIRIRMIDKVVDGAPYLLSNDVDVPAPPTP